MTRQQPPTPQAPATARRSWRATTLGPFKHRIFLAIWLASLASNFGTMVQAVGASWLMTSLAPSPDMVALVQAATALPIMLLALPAGAIADISDRRRLMLFALMAMLAVSATLAFLTYGGHVGAWSLLALTFLIGCGSALYAPAWQASVGDQVPRAELPAAVALNSLGFNLARTAGPAIGGAIVATAGPAAAFTLNAFSYVALIIVLATWRREVPPRVLPPESVGAAMFAGLRYVGMAPTISSVLVRSLAFGLAASAVWALMPVVARDLIGGDALIFGIMLGAFGVGAVAAALSNASLHHRFRNDPIVTVATLAFGAATVTIGLSDTLLATLPALVVAGGAWVLALSSFNITVQTSSPRWVVGRTLAIYQMVTFGGIAIGSWGWGELADRTGITPSLVAAGAVMATSALLGLRHRLPQWERLNLEPSRAWPEPQTKLDLVPQSGPVVVTVEYRIADEDQNAFIVAMREVRRIRRRDGARRWMLLQDIADPERWIERFHSPTWIDHLRHHHRVTVADREVESRAYAYHQGPEPPRISHLLERPPTAPPRTRKVDVETEAERAARIDLNLPS
jgi:MFS family permease